MVGETIGSQRGTICMHTYQIVTYLSYSTTVCCQDRYVGSSRPPPPLPPTGGDNYRSSGGGDPHPHYGGGRYEGMHEETRINSTVKDNVDFNSFSPLAPPPSHAAPYSNIHAAPAPAPYIQPERAPFNQAMIPPPIPNPNVGGPGSDMPRSGEHQVHVGNVSATETLLS